MPSSGSRVPRAATVEDWDEDTQSILPGSRASANVTKKRSQTFAADAVPVSDKKSQNGSDSGYSSKTATTADSTPNIQKPTHITVIPAMDRIPQPYSHTPASARPSKPTRTPSVKIQEPPKDKSSRSARKGTKLGDRTVDGVYVPKTGTYTTCDEFGYHMEHPVRPATTAPIQSQPQSRSLPLRAKDDGMVRPRSSRRSSRHEQRPQSMFIGLTPQQEQQQQHAAYNTSVFDYGGQHPVQPLYNWQPAPTMVSGQPYGYGYAAPLSSSFSDHNSFLEPRFGGPHPSQQYSYAPQYVSGSDPKTVQSKARKIKHEGGEKAARPRSGILKSAKDRELDKLAMPPPPPPGKQLPLRPPARRASTEQSASTKPNRMRPVSVHYESDSSNGYSSSSDEAPPPRVKRTSREIKPSHKPPTAWKGPSVADILSGVSGRPATRKSVSYSDGSAITNVASSRESLRRRSTDPLESHLTTMERRVKDAEDHQAKTSKGITHADLASEVFQKFAKHGGLPSEADTDNSYQSSSRASRKGRRSSTVLSQPTQITFDGGVSVHIPQEGLEGELRFHYNNVTVSLGPTTPDGFQNESRVPEQMKQIERAPSNASRGSRRSGVGAAMVGDVFVERDIPRSFGHTEQSKAKANSSKRSNRAHSVSRRSNEHSRQDQFIDFMARPEQYYGA